MSKITAEKRNYTRENQCVYILFDPTKQGHFRYGEYEFNLEPFYVGKGSEKRPYKHTKAVKNNWSSPAYNRNKEKKEKILKILEIDLCPKIELIRKGMGAEEACQLEIDIISKIGRFDLKLGPLTNKTPGGDGLIDRVRSQEIRLKMSENHADFKGSKNPFYGKTHSEEFRREISERNRELYRGKNNPMYGVHRFGKDSPHYGKKHSEETKKRLSELKKGKRHTKEAREKMSESHKNPSLEFREKISKVTKGINNPRACHYFCTNKSGEIVECIMVNGLKEFCKNHKVSYGEIKKVLNRDIYYKDWKFTSIRRRLLCKQR